MIGLMPKVSDKAERLRKHILITYAVIHKNAVIILSCYLFAEYILCTAEKNNNSVRRVITPNFHLV